MNAKILNIIQVTEHKMWVIWYSLWACAALIKRAITHDLSKYSKREAPYFERALYKLRDLDYGTEDYQDALASLGPALAHHYHVNSHHPEHYLFGISAMSPLDQIEMLCDWRAAGRRHKTGDMAKSLEINRERFEALARLHDALERDAREIGLVE